MQIALCDDDENLLKTLEIYIDAYSKARGICIQCDRFTNAEDLLNSSHSYQIIIMDIYLGSLNGIDAIRLHRQSNNCPVVFISCSREHAVEAFGVNATHYLVKPLTEEAVATALDRCLEQLDIRQTSENFLELKTNYQIIFVPENDITYIEVFNKVCVVHTREKEFRTYTPLNVLYDALDREQFMKPQRSFIVNMNYIDAFLSDHLTLLNGQSITLSRGNCAKLKAQYQQYLFHLARRKNL